jgi:Protein of unknown function (DUF3800)
LTVLRAGYFDDSGSDSASRWYVLAGFVATVDQWKGISKAWAQVLRREELPYFKMSQAMAFDGPFRRNWTAPLRDQLILELVDIVAEVNPWRIECFLKRDLFDTFVRGLLQSDAFNDPYFILFYQIVLSIAANAPRIGWNTNCDFIFDEQGKLGDVAKSKWKWMKQNIERENTELKTIDVNSYLGSPPIFRNDIKFMPLQTADMFAWLVRDCMTMGPDNMEEISRVALKHLESSKDNEQRILRLHIDKEMLMKLGAAFIVGKARLDGHL